MNEMQIEVLSTAYDTIVSTMSEADMLRTGYSLIASKPAINLGYSGGMHVIFGDGNLSTTDNSFKFATEAMITDITSKEENPKMIEGPDYISMFLVAIMRRASLRTRIKFALLAGYHGFLNTITSTTPVDFDIHLNTDEDLAEMEELRKENPHLEYYFREAWKEIDMMASDKTIAYDLYIHEIRNSVIELGVKVNIPPTTALLVNDILKAAGANVSMDIKLDGDHDE